MAVTVARVYIKDNLIEDKVSIKNALFVIYVRDG